MDAFRLHPRKPFLWLSLAAIAGIVAADLRPLPAGGLLIACVFGAGCVFFCPVRVLCLLLTAFAFAALHTMQHGEHAGRYQAAIFAAAPAPVTGYGVVWSEPDAFADGRGRDRATFWMRITRLEANDEQRELDGLCLIRWSGMAPAYGDRVQVRGTARALDESRNPGEFDSANWLRRQGIYFQIVAASASDCVVNGHGAGAWPRQFAIAARQWIQERLALGLSGDPAAASLIQSMVLGLRGETPADLKELFQKTGTLHLFAVSGLNVAMLAAIAWYVLKPLQLGRKGAAFLIIPLLLAYAIVTGLSASCLRATIMAAFVLLAPLAERRAVPVNSIAAAALVILAWDTNQLFSPGFQLSFVLALVILALAFPIQRRLEPLALPDEFIPQRLWTHGQRARIAVWRLFAVACGVTIAAWLGSLLFTAGYFHLISPSAIVANLVCVPLAFFILALGLFSLIASLCSMALAMVINQANWLCASGLIATVSAFARIPGGHVYVEWPRAGPPPICELTVLDAGEGAAIHIRTGGDDWLLDTGHARDYARTLLPYLRSRGVNRLDGLLLSHGDGAHLGGAAAVLHDFAPRWLGEHGGADRSPIRRTLHAELAARNLGRRFLARGDEISLAHGATLRVLYPPSNLTRSRADDKALVCMIEAAGRRVFLVSDAGFHTEQWLLTHEAGLHADVLVKGWPDRDLSGTPDFIAAVQPQVIVCAGQAFGSGAEQFSEWAAPLTAKGIVVLSQRTCGAVRIRIETNGLLQVEKWRLELR